MLPGSVQRLGTLNKFAADILDIVDGSVIDGYEETYSDFSQGFELIPKLVAQLIWGISLAEIKASSAGNYKIEITQKIHISTKIDFTGFENKTITIQGGGSITFSGDSSFSVRKDVVIILDNIHLIGNSFSVGGRLEMRKDAIISGGVNIGGSGIFIMNSGQITNDRGNDVVVYSGSIFTMNGGQVYDNKTGYDGGGVYVGRDERFVKKKGKAKITGTDKTRDVVGGKVKRYKEAGSSVTLDSNISGKRGGWE